mgnify:CR=1 FL=1
MDNLKEWKKQQRQQLIAARESVAEDLHRQWSGAISAFLKQGLAQPQHMTIGIYWPFRGEYDPRPLAAHFLQRGAALALPEVAEKNKPPRPKQEKREGESILLTICPYDE